MNSSQQGVIQAPKRLLIRGVNWLGDAVMSTPALLRLRQALPNTHIAILTHAKLADLWKNHPAINQVLTFNPGDNIFSVSRNLRRWHFDAALAFPNSHRSALELWFAGIPIRAGLSKFGRNLFLTHPIPPPPFLRPMRKRTTRQIRAIISSNIEPSPAYSIQNHHSLLYLHLVSKFGADSRPIQPMLEVTPEELDAFRSRFAIENKLVLGICPGAEYGPAKRWPPDYFKKTAGTVHRNSGCLWLIFGGAADEETASYIASGLPNGSCINLAGKTSLRELCAALKLCRIVLTNDSGPMHVAAAVGTRVIALFGSTSPELTGPGLPGDSNHIIMRANVSCSPCFRRSCPIDYRCLKNITPEQLVPVILKSL